MKTCLVRASSGAARRPAAVAGYSLKRRLAEDAAGEMYLARHTGLDKFCVVKFIAAEAVRKSSVSFERINQEIEAAARVIHRSVVGIFDFGTLENGDFYVVSELIRGRTLREHLNDCELFDEKTASRIARQTALGLEAVHRAGVVHHAVNPANIVVAPDGGGRFLVKICNFDFGGLRQDLTLSGAAATDADALKYFSPEQRAGHAAEGRTDVYSLAVVFYEMLVGRKRFEREEDISRQLVETPQFLSRFEAGEMLTQIFALSLKQNPVERILTAADFAEQLANLEYFIERLQTCSEAAAKIENPPAEANFAEETAPDDFETVCEKPVSVAAFQLESVVAPVVDSDGAQKNSAGQAKSFFRRAAVRRVRFNLLAAASLGLIALLTSAVWVTVSFERQRQRESQDLANRLTVVSPEPAELSAAQIEENAFAESEALAEIPRRNPMAELNTYLNEWIAATNARDLNRQMNYYASSINAFYQARNTSPRFVHSEKKRVFGDAEFVSMKASQPSIILSQNGDSAKMRFRKKYVIAGGRQNRSGEVLQELSWVKSGDDWKIVGERDLKVIYR